LGDYNLFEAEEVKVKYIFTNEHNSNVFQRPLIETLKVQRRGRYLATQFKNGLFNESWLRFEWLYMPPRIYEGYSFSGSEFGKVS
jgi:hypothetical protein